MMSKNSDDRSHIVDHVDGPWITDLCQRMVEIPSVTMNEQDVCIMFEHEMRELGLDVDVRDVTPGRRNLYARIPGVGGGPTLMFNGHLDTIPNANDQLCFRDGDRIYGRGTTDMKGGMAAMLGAFRALCDANVCLNGDVVLTAVVGHEQPVAKKDGPLALIDDVNDGRLQCDRIVIVEGNDAVWVMSMGSMNFHVTLSSKRGGTHTQYVDFQDNPVRFVGDLIQRMVKFQDELNETTNHPLAGPERIDIGIVKAGDYFNRTPAICRLTGTRRWTPGRSAPQVLQELHDLVVPIAAAGELELEVVMEHQRESFETSVDDPAVLATASAHRYVTGAEVEFEGRRIVGDANLYVHGTSIPTYYYGPSNKTAHADVEWVSVERMISAAKVYALTAAEYCGIASAP